MGSIQCDSLVLIYALVILLVFDVAVSTGADDTLNIAAILDMSTLAGKTANTSLQYALQDVNGEAANGTLLKLTIQDSRGFVGNVLQVFRSELAAILVQDPKISGFLASVAEEVHVPILSFSGSHGFGTASESTYLLSTFPSRHADMNAIAAIAAYFQWKSVVVVYEDDEFWLNGVHQLTEALQEFQEDCGSNRPAISQTVALSSGSRPEQINETLVELNNKSCVRAFIVHTSVDLALKMFSIAQDLHMMAESYVWVVTDSVASALDSLSSSSIQQLQGIAGVKSVPSSQFIELRKRLRLSSSDDGINRIGIQAYSSLKLIATAVAALRSQDIKIGYDGQTLVNDTDFPASTKILTGGELLRREIANSESGAVSDDLEILEYEIINVIGRSYKRVGFWAKRTGLRSPRQEENKLGAVIWPGDTIQVPNGYRKLVIAKIMGKRASNFSEFIGRLSGYTDDTFKAAVDSLPYSLPFVYRAFDKGNSTLSNYDALVSALSDGNTFDAVVGDATILWNRSLYVGFTQPYTQTGLVMMVPLKRERGRTWTFLHPFTAGLWAIAGVFFVFTAFLVWLMEHEDNDEFKGKVNEQIITSLALSLSAFVFAQREEVKSTLGKGIVAIWLFIALILNNSYTAHLTSLLTVERLAPTITSMKSLNTSNVKVGYMNTSFAKSYLIDDLKIPQDRLVPLVSPHDYVRKLLSGEVGAIVDESLYIQIVKSLYPCAKVEVVDRGYFDTGGFGFFFRKGSPFLSDITEAVLNVSERHFMVQSIRNKWFGETTTSCPDMDTGLESKNTPITPANLWILFVLTASIYALTALIHIGRKLHRSRQGLRAAYTQDFSTHVMTMIKSLKIMRAPPSIEIQP